MKNIIWMMLLVSCAQVPAKQKDLVSLDAALNQAQASYLKGCVDVMKDLKIPVSFPDCRDKSLDHRRELDSIMDQDL
jgi:hypothetical protein